MINILSTKKLLPTQKEVLTNAGFDVTDQDFIEIKYKDFKFSHLGSALIFTSQNAVQSVLQHPDCAKLKNKKVFCVGSKTKALLEKNGFTVTAHMGYAEDLAEIISLVYLNESYTFFCGNLRRDVLPENLKANDIAFHEIEVYETVLSPKKTNENFDAILFFSPSGVESYLKNNSITNEICIAIGETTAQALENKKVKNVIVAQRPTVEDVIEECINEFK